MSPIMILWDDVPTVIRAYLILDTLATLFTAIVFNWSIMIEILFEWFREIIEIIYWSDYESNTKYNDTLIALNLKSNCYDELQEQYNHLNDSNIIIMNQLNEVNKQLLEKIDTLSKCFIEHKNTEETHKTHKAGGKA